MLNISKPLYFDDDNGVQSSLAFGRQQDDALAAGFGFEQFGLDGELCFGIVDFFSDFLQLFGVGAFGLQHGFDLAVQLLGRKQQRHFVAQVLGVHGVHFGHGALLLFLNGFEFVFEFLFAADFAAQVCAREEHGGEQRDDTECVWVHGEMF